VWRVTKQNSASYFIVLNIVLSPLVVIVQRNQILFQLYILSICHGVLDCFVSIWLIFGNRDLVYRVDTCYYEYCNCNSEFIFHILSLEY
jgi:hypothetical protein